MKFTPKKKINDEKEVPTSNISEKAVASGEQYYRLPRLKEFIQPLTEIEYANLETSILQEGCRDSIIYWKINIDGLEGLDEQNQIVSIPKYANVIVDGHHRFEICRKHNVIFKTESKSFTSLEEVENFMISHQLSRRNLNNEQRKYFIGKQYNSLKSGVGVSKESGSTLDMLQGTFNVSKRSISNYAEIAIVLDLASKDLRDRHLMGKLPIKNPVFQSAYKERESIENMDEFLTRGKVLVKPKKNKGYNEYKASLEKVFKQYGKLAEDMSGEEKNELRHIAMEFIRNLDA